MRILKWSYFQGFVKYMHHAKGSQDDLWVWRLSRRTHSCDLLQNQENEKTQGNVQSKPSKSLIPMESYRMYLVPPVTNHDLLST